MAHVQPTNLHYLQNNLAYYSIPRKVYTIYDLAIAQILYLKLLTWP